MSNSSNPEATDDGDPSISGPDSIHAVRDVIEQVGRPVITAADVARSLECSQATAVDALQALTDGDSLCALDVPAADTVYYLGGSTAATRRERIIPFPERREIVVEYPRQLTRAQLSQFGRLSLRNNREAYVYEVTPEDIWGAPYESLESLLETVRSVLPERSESFEEYIESQWRRARQFTLETHEDGYTVLVAGSDSLMGNVAMEVLDEDQVHGLIDDDRAWIVEGSEAAVKRVLYDAGYPVRDERDLDGGDPLEFTVTVGLREYQRSWVDRFDEAGTGVLVGPAGSGKTVAALGIMASVGGESLVLVPSRELAEQWREQVLRQTSLTADDVGCYHGGEKSLRPVTIATYAIAGMDRHRSLFDARRWGLIVYDEAHRVPAPVNRMTANLQSRHRLGLTASPVREDENAREIYALIGPPIGTDWDALFDAGHVAEPTVEIRYVPWMDSSDRDAYDHASSHQRRQLAATNPRKTVEVEAVIQEHPEAKTIVFVEYLDQGETIADRLGVPFVSGETPHARRSQLFDEFRRGERETLVVSRVGDEGIDLPDAELAVVASGLGGSARQGTQRAGRTMRPEGGSTVILLATRGTADEEFARRRMRYLAGKGIEVRERDITD